MMVTCRRSAMEPDRVDGGGCRIDAEDTGAPAIRLVPQLEQKLESAWLARPHEGHCRDRRAPHLAQNLLSSATFALQLGHCIATLRQSTWDSLTCSQLGRQI